MAEEVISREEFLEAAPTPAPVRPEMRSVTPEDEKHLTNVSLPSAWQTLQRSLIRPFLAFATTEGGQRARMAEKFNEAVGGLGEDAEVIHDKDNNALFVVQGGKVTPLDPDFFDAPTRAGNVAEGVVDFVEDTVRAGPSIAGSIVGSAGGIPVRMAGAGGGELVRQGAEEVATRTILGEPSAVPLADRALDVASAAGMEGVLPFAGKIARGLNIMPSRTVASGNRAAVDATERIRTRAVEAGIPNADQVGLGPGERGAPIWRSMTAQARNLGGLTQERGALRDDVVYQLVEQAATRTPAEERAFSALLEQQRIESRDAGVQMIRDVTGIERDVPLHQARGRTQERVREYIEAQQARIRPLYEQSAAALRNSGGALIYDDANVQRAFNEARGLNRLPGRAGAPGRTVRGDLPEDLDRMQREISARAADGWPTLTLGGITLTPERQISDFVTELGSMRAAFANGTGAERTLAANINDIRRELVGMLDNPRATPGADPAVVEFATSVRREAKRQYAQFRGIMDRVQEHGLDVGDKRTVQVLEKITKGEGADMLEVIRGVPGVRESVLEYFTTKAAKSPDDWADNVLAVRDDVMLEVLGGDNQANRVALQNLKQAAEFSKVRSETITRALKNESEPIKRVKDTLFSDQTQAGRDIADQARAGGLDSPGARRVGAAVLSWVFDQAGTRGVNAPSAIRQKALVKAMERVRALGYDEFIPPDQLQLLDDAVLYGSRSITPGGMAQGLVQAEAGARGRKEISESLVGIGEGQEQVAPLAGLPSVLFNIVRGLGGTEAVGAILTSPGTSRIVRSLRSAKNATERLGLMGDFMATMGRQAIISDRMAGSRASAQDRRDANQPAPAGL